MPRGLLVSPAVRAFLGALARVDARACLGGSTALAVHLDRAPEGPIVVLASRLHRVPAPLVGTVRLRRGAPREPLRRDGMPVEPRLDAFLRVLSGRGAECDAALLAATARALDPAERGALSKRSTGRSADAAATRAAFLVARATGVVFDVPSTRASVVLRRGAPAIGPRDPATGVRINAPPEVPLTAEEAGALVDAARATLARDARRLLALGALGVSLEPAILAEIFGPGPWEARLRALVDRGLVSRSGTAMAPFDRPGSIPLADDDLARTLAVLTDSTEGRRRLESVEVRVRLGRSDALDHALAEAPGALERGEVARVERWLAALGPTEPARTGALSARVLERRGRLADALARIRTALEQAAPRERPALLVDRARLSWRAGRAEEARAALRALARSERTDGHATDHIEAELLRASIALERGDTTRARTHLGRARARAEKSGDEESLARVLRRLGTLEARAGRPGPASGAYRAALAALRRAPRTRDPSLEATLLSNLATTEGWLGRHAEAERLYQEALGMRRGQPLEALNTRAALALLDAARGRRPLGGAFEALSDEAERLGEPRLRAELSIYRAEELAFEGRLAAAEDALARARTALAELGGAEVVLEAMSEAAEGALRARRGERAASALFDHAIDRLVAAGARYHAARTAREAAAAALWLGADERALEHLERSAVLCDEVGVVLGLERAHAPAMVAAALFGTPRARAHATGELERVGDIRIAAWLRGAGRSDLEAAWAGRALEDRRGPPFHALGPEGAHLMFEAERDALLERSNVVVLDRTEHRLHVPGRPPRSLARMRQVEPLLAVLSARRPEPVSLAELARSVWGQRESRSVVAAITTSIARLRRLVAPLDVVRTVGSGPRRAYAVSADAPLYAIERRGERGA